MTLEAAIANLQAKALALPGMLAAPETPPESVDVYPFAVSYERSGSLQLRSATFADDLATIFTEIHVSRQFLSLAIQTAMSFRDPLLKAILADPKLGDSVSTVLAIRRTFGTLVWGDIDTIGYRFETDVKVTLVST